MCLPSAELAVPVIVCPKKADIVDDLGYVTWLRMSAMKKSKYLQLYHCWSEFVLVNMLNYALDYM